MVLAPRLARHLIVLCTVRGRKTTRRVAVRHLTSYPRLHLIDDITTTPYMIWGDRPTQRFSAPMALERRRSKAVRPDVTVAPEAPPGIAALFLIRFDIRAGSIEDVELDNVVEYKSLPSGLHNVREDLIYFVHDEYAGISAFVNQPAGESQRNALMMAVGVLVPLSYGRLGKGWRHAGKLKELASRLADEPDDTEPLSNYWETYQLLNEGPSPPDSPLGSIASLRTPVREGFTRSRALSDATALMSSKQALAPHHPASSLPELIDTFGPLIFPLYRAALLRKRILLVGEAPVEESCNFVYDLSLLSSLPQSLLPLLPPTASPALRPRPLFSIGIHDMPYLSSLPRPTITDPDTCWIACTTDRVLSLKPELYDVIVNLPASYSKHAPVKVYPKITLSSPLPMRNQKAVKPINLKATQRDARRYLNLRSGLNELSRVDSASGIDGEDDSDGSSTFSSNTIVEPVSWPLLAYTSFIWWASAGEKRGVASEGEDEQDSRLLIDNDNAPNPTYPSHVSRRGSIAFLDHGQQPREIALITYFRRLTTQIFTVLSDAIARQDEESYNDNDYGQQTESSSLRDDISPDPDSGLHQHSTLDASTSLNDPLLPSSARHDSPDDDETITIASSDMTEMGLDAWSATDRAFVEELVGVWWGRKAQVHGARINCCGVRIL
ncbi:hypothetical protein FQN55_003301 [Onygenales sp. PD_40]|nr:hypothetical protein FQN55_003301 [Onygenales sp. PD_40]